MTFLVLLGAPGAGKGTQAQVLSQRLGLPHIATGDLFRAAVRSKTPIGLEAKQYMDRGELVPDLVTVRMLLDRLGDRDAQKGVILDGFPRNRNQAEVLDVALAERGKRVDQALLIDVPTDELARRLSGRWTCQANGHVFNEVTNPPRVPGVCDFDGSPLYQRDDDRIATVRARLAQQLGALRDVVAYYRDSGVLETVDGTRSIPKVSEDLVGIVSSRIEGPR